MTTDTLINPETAAHQHQMAERAHVVAEALLGTCGTVDDHATEDERDDPTFCAHLDSTVGLCDQCGWWVDASELDENDRCEGCATDDDEEEES